MNTSSMLIEDDTIPASRYHAIFSNEKKDNKTLSASSGAIKVADVMPEFPERRFIHDFDSALFWLYREARYSFLRWTRLMETPYDQECSDAKR